MNRIDRTDEDDFPIENYHMPPEWEKQEGTWLSWPYNLETFEDFLPQVEQAYIKFIFHLTSCQKVFLVVHTEAMKEKVQIKLIGAKIPQNQVEYFTFQTQDVWFRDYGPIYIKKLDHTLTDNETTNTEKEPNPPIVMLNWEYNAWGNKYDDLLPDNETPQNIHARINLPMISPKMVLEGGSIEVNGEGIMLTSEQCLLNANRNPQLSKIEIESQLKRYLGVKQIWWLEEGIIGDDTDGHIDDIARFVDSRTIVCCIESNMEDANYLILHDNYQRLLNYTKDKPDWKVVTIPMPSPVIINEIRLPASYANFYIANNVVLVPIFGKKQDKEALAILQNLFPSRKVIGINCESLVYGLGTLHCISQQVPQI